MKRSKEESNGNQMFPRLKINDADKGGPRAPPRNKMALYEQLSIPSLKLESTLSSSSVLPLPLNNTAHFDPSSSLAHNDKRVRCSYGGFAASSNADDRQITEDLLSSRNFSHIKNLYCKKSVEVQPSERGLMPRIGEDVETSTTESNRSFPPLARDNDANWSRRHITTDDVVKAIGEKQFWETRRAIVNQQRVFSNQVFELHKLVERMIAGCPNVLLQDNLYREPTASPNNDPLKDTSPEDEPHKGNEREPQQTDIVQKEGNVKGTAWCLPPAGRQLLVPVMSPSEGLVYKPYSGAYSCTETVPLVPIMGTVPVPVPVPVRFVGGGFPVRSGSVLSSRMSGVRESGRLESSESSSQALNLFPLEPSSSEHSKRVIKVTPYNPTSVSESVARIFQSIQKDRKHC